ncbi:MAG: S41 family peptidase [Actinomycetota bacterium]
MFQRISTRILAVVTGLGLLTASFFFGFGVGTSNSREDSPYKLLDEAQELIEASALQKPAQEELIQGAVRGLLHGLDDPHASFLDAQAYRQFSEEHLTGQFSGVGLWLNRDQEQVKVVTVLAGSPAELAGILAGDVITTVDGKSVSGLLLDEVAQKILGKPGTQVRISILRDGGDAPEEFLLSRKRLELPSVKSSLKGSVGVIELVSFTGGAGQKVRDAIRSLEGQGAKGFILDMRGNPGGVLDQAVEVASLFLDGGVVVAYRERGKQEVIFEAEGRQQTKLPLVVLVDEGSASASEIVAGAIQDRHRGLIVGNETYKKGSVQRVFGLSDGSAIKLTIASYFTPSGRAIGERGVIPDVTVAERDRQLPRATEILSGIVAESPSRPTS